MLYDRPVADLMVEASAALSERFRPNDIVEWFAQHYPKAKASTVRAHVIGLTANDPSRKHYPGLARRQPVFFKSPNGWLERFDPDVHLTDEPVASYADDDEELELVESEDMEPDPSQGVEGTQEFYLEAYLEEFLVSNWAQFGLGSSASDLVKSDGPKRSPALHAVGRLDILCKDLATGALVVVELKRGRPSDRVVGQVARYMGWVTQHLGEGRRAEGNIVAHEADDRLTYAVQAVPGLSLLVYEINFALRPPGPNVR